MKLPITIEEGSPTPIYHQIESQLKEMIIAGHLQAGTALPSIRLLATELACSVITTRRAYQNLEQHGYIKTTQGKGTFVALIDEKKKEEKKLESVYHALRQGIETGRRHNYSNEEIKQMIDEILNEV